MTIQTKAEGIQWDLSDLYRSPEDPKISEDLKRGESLALAFEKKYKPLFEKICQNGAFPLAELLKDYKEIATLLTRIGVYSYLLFAEKTNVASIGAFMQKTQDQLTYIQSHLLFWDVAWNKLGDNTVEKLTGDPKVATDKHYLMNLR